MAVGPGLGAGFGSDDGLPGLEGGQGLEDVGLGQPPNGTGGPLLGAGGPPPGGDGFGDGQGGFGGGRGGPGEAQVSQDVLDYLVANRGEADWIVAVNGSASAAPIQLATGLPVMTMGGFSGGDASPTLAEFQAYVADGSVRYVIAGADGGAPGGRGSSDVDAWVTSTCTAVTVGATTLYDCGGAS